MSKSRTRKRKCQHYDEPNIVPCLTAFYFAVQLLREGHKQRKCQVCGLWIWDVLWKKKRLTRRTHEPQATKAFG